MINISNEARRNIDDRHSYTAKVKITLKDSTVLNLAVDDIMIDSGFNFEHGTSSQGSFDIGSAVIGKFSLTINNMTEKFSLYDFSEAMVVPYVGVEYIVEDELDGGNFFDYASGDNVDGGNFTDYSSGDSVEGGLVEHKIEWIQKGVYSVDEARYNGFSVTLECLDNIAEFEKPYSLSNLRYPATLRQIWQDACSMCKIRTTTMRFTNDDYSVQERPDVSNFREILSYVAQLSGSYVKADVYGNINLDWYDVEYLKEESLDGGDLLNYDTGHNADGGNLIDYKSGDNYDGGLVTEASLQNKFYINRISSITVGTDEIKVTGVQIKLNEKKKDSEGNDVSEEVSYLYGTGDYVLNIERNPLYQKHSDAVLQNIAEKVIGINLRPIEVSHLGDPSIEPGDCGIVIDNKGNSYLTIATNVSFNLGQYAKLTEDCETIKENRATRSNVVTEAMKISKQEIYEKMSAYDISVRNLNQLMSNALGFYQTKVVQDDGSTIEYLHDKPTLEESTTIWKMTADGFAVSRDGGKTFIAGMTSDGGIVATVLDSIGVRAEWINAQELDISNNKSLFDSKTGIITNISNQFSVSLENMQSTYNKKFSDSDGKFIDLESSIKQAVDSISLCVREDNLISAINMSKNKISMNSIDIDLTGYVTINSISSPKSMIINGSNIALIGSSSMYYKNSLSSEKEYNLLGRQNNEIWLGNTTIETIDLQAKEVIIGNGYDTCAAYIWTKGNYKYKVLTEEGINNVKTISTKSLSCTESFSCAGKFGAFGKTPVSRPSVKRASMNELSDIRESLTSVVTALQSLGLVSV